jgi:hypothetical protein
MIGLTSPPYSPDPKKVGRIHGVGTSSEVSLCHRSRPRSHQCLAMLKGHSDGSMAADPPFRKVIGTAGGGHQELSDACGEMTFNVTFRLRTRTPRSTVHLPGSQKYESGSSIIGGQLIRRAGSTGDL